MENIKGKIIPNELKENIDEILEQQLFNANRYYAETNPDISNLMIRELSNKPEVFLERLTSRWNWHNLFYEILLEPAFSTLIKKNDIELSPKEIEDLIRVYSTACLVDEATLVMSGVIKKYLDVKCKNISLVDENLNLLETSKMLITPPVETFFAQYQIDHLYYIYLLKNNNENTYKFKKYLLNKYHANDEIIFNSRFNKKFRDSFKLTEKQLLEKIKRYTISDSYKVNHFYFTLENSTRKAIRDIIIYDNVDEKFIASNLIGISGFLLRRKILEYLNTSRILSNKGYIYEFNNKTVIDGLEVLKEERKKKMDKDVKPYKQRGNTCAIVCMMMVLEYYNVIKKANWYDEKRLYKIYGSKYMEGTPFSALTFHFSKNGLDTTIYHSDANLFNNNKKVLSENEFKSSLDEYKEYLDRSESKGTKVINGIDINSKLIKEKLQEGNLVILAGKISNIYHAILVTGYKNAEFIVCDPLYKTKQIRKIDEIEKFMDTDIGKWFIAVSDNTKKKNKLLDNLEKFEIDANKMMDKKNNRSFTYVKK